MISFQITSLKAIFNSTYSCMSVISSPLSSALCIPAYVHYLCSHNGHPLSSSSNFLSAEHPNHLSSCFFKMFLPVPSVTLTLWQLGFLMRKILIHEGITEICLCPNWWFKDNHHHSIPVSFKGDMLLFTIQDDPWMQKIISTGEWRARLFVS